MLRFRVTESLSKREFLRIGEGCALHVENQIRSMDIDLARAERILDFGCGCGRTLRWLIPKYPNLELYATDVDGEAIRWCQANLSKGRFVQNSPEPPLPFPADYFDIVYCFSVFTHLDEAMQDAWLDELRRVLRSGGVLFLTVHGRNAESALGESGLDALRERGFVHRRSRKLKGIVPEWYNTSWHSPEYIVDRLLPLFSDVRYVVVGDGMQDIVLAKVGVVTKA